MHCGPGQRTVLCRGLAALKHTGVRNMRNGEGKPMRKGGYKELKIFSYLHTCVITNLPICSSALLTSSPNLCMEVLFKLQTGLRCVPLKRESSCWDKPGDGYLARSQTGKEKQIKGLFKNGVFLA